MVLTVHIYTVNEMIAILLFRRKSLITTVKSHCLQIRSTTVTFISFSF